MNAISPTLAKMHGRKVTVHYGSKQALFDVDLDVPERMVTALIGPSGCGKSTFLRCLNRMNDVIDGCKVGGEITLDGQDIYEQQARRRHAARAHRHGVPEAEPVPQIDLRQRGLWPAHPRHGRDQGRPGRDRARQPRKSRPLERGQGAPGPARHRPFRRPAAAPVHRPRHRGRARKSS